MRTCFILGSGIGSCLFLRKLAASVGYECDIAYNMADGLRAAAAKHFDLVLIACLKGDRGCWVAHEAIKLLHPEGFCPAVIGILSCPDSAIQQRCESSGMLGVLVHPVTKSALLGCIENTTPKARYQDTRSEFTTSCCACESASLQQGASGNAECDKRAQSPQMADTALPPLALSALELQEAGPLSLGELNSK